MAAKNLLQKLRSSPSSSSSSSSPPVPLRHQATDACNLQSVPAHPSGRTGRSNAAGGHENPFTPFHSPPACLPASHRLQPCTLSPKSTAYAAAIMPRQSPDDEYDGVCVVCMEVAPAVMFWPCLHAVACNACASKIVARSNECPMCRSQVKSVETIRSAYS